MDYAGKLITYALGLGLTLAAMGKLPQATLWMPRQAANAQPQMLSLGKLNRALINGESRATHYRHNHPKHSAEKTQ